MVRTNEKRLVEMSVVGEITHPPLTLYRVGADGKPRALPGTGGISYNIRIGMSAVEWEADHVEPGVSCRNFAKQFDASSSNVGFNVLSQIGNTARVISGDAKGSVGIVTGKHGGIEHVLVDFDPSDMEKMAPGDKVLVRAFGLGLKFPDFPDVTVMNVDPRILPRLGLKDAGGRLIVPVHLTVPAAVMGSGLGHNQTYSGDYDIQMFDPDTVREYKLDRLRFGDMVAILDAYSGFGRIYRRGHLIIGVVVHSCCTTAGHGPGVTTIFTGSAEHLGFELSDRANLAFALGIGIARDEKRRAAQTARRREDRRRA